MARALGSYPNGRWFKSDFRYQRENSFYCFLFDPKVYTKNILRLVGQVVKTRPFHGCNTGSTPVRVTKSEQEKFSCSDFLVFYKKGILLNPDKFFLKK